MESPRQFVQIFSELLRPQTIGIDMMVNVARVCPKVGKYCGTFMLNRHWEGLAEVAAEYDSTGETTRMVCGMEPEATSKPHAHGRLDTRTKDNRYKHNTHSERMDRTKQTVHWAKRCVYINTRTYSIVFLTITKEAMESQCQQSSVSSSATSSQLLR